MKIWNHVVGPFVVSNALRDCLYKVSFWRYSSLSIEVYEQRPIVDILGTDF